MSIPLPPRALAPLADSFDFCTQSVVQNISSYSRAKNCCASVWGYRTPSRTVDSHACRLRRKLSGCRERLVINVWGIGYRLCDPPAPSSQSRPGTHDEPARPAPRARDATHMSSPALVNNHRAELTRAGDKPRAPAAAEARAGRRGADGADRPRCRLEAHPMTSTCPRRRCPCLQAPGATPCPPAMRFVTRPQPCVTRA